LRKPKRQVCGRLQGGEVAVQLQKHFLRQILGTLPVREHAQRQSEYRALVCPDDVGERRGLTGARP
jgi:hypothetical protein